MGLDMYALATKAKPETDVDFSTKNFEQEELHYWRKHPNLHGWMQNLYDAKGGTSHDFNGDCVVLDSEDLDNLEQDIQYFRNKGIKKVNLFNEQLSTSLLINTFFPDKINLTHKGPESSYDLCTIHGNNNYLNNIDTVMNQLNTYINQN